MKHLFGRVTVNVAVVEAVDQKAAEKLFGKPLEHRTKADKENIEGATFVLGWTEFPGQNPTVKRDEVLASFLQLMAQQIPFTRDAQPYPIIQLPKTDGNG